MRVGTTRIWEVSCPEEEKSLQGKRNEEKTEGSAEFCKKINDERYTEPESLTLGCHTEGECGEEGWPPTRRARFCEPGRVGTAGLFSK